MIQAAVIAALVTAATSLIIAIFNAWRTRKLEQARTREARDLEHLRHELDNLKGLRDARRDYEFEARKRLYIELEPLLFQGQDTARRLFHRVANMAHAAREGQLGRSPHAWLRKGHIGYYRKSLVHRFAQCWAIHQLSLRRLTHIDQSLDPEISRRIEVQAALYEILSDHFRIAEAEPSIPYDPHASSTGESLQLTPKTRMQGVTIGDIDKVALFIINVDGIHPEYPMGLGEFERKLEESAEPSVRSIFKVASMFDDFHPSSHPVLWRALVASACLCWILIELRNNSNNTPEELAQRFFSDKRVVEKFNWLGDEQNDRDSIESPATALQAAQFQIITRLSWQRDPLS